VTVPDPLSPAPAAGPQRSFRNWLIPLVPFLIGGLALAWLLAHGRQPAAAPPEVVITNLTRVNGIWCRRDHTNPFTGFLLEYYTNGVLESRSMVSNGLLEGLSEGWYTNRQLQVREYYRTNFSNGWRTKWYPDGHKQSEAQIVAGQMEGLFRRWYDSGQLAEEIPMRDGKIEGTGRSYYPSGFLKSEITIHDGDVTSAKKWDDGQRPAPAPGAGS
jgi:antitoxin component YwqK of YwqJK toxin-antitoxin module